MDSNKRISLYSLFIWMLAILFFFYEFFLRIFLGTIATEIMSDLRITVSQFSIIGAGYYLLYGLMQPFVGILTEKFGARKILTFAAALCTLGVFWLSIGESFYPALFSRMLIGLGSAFGFVTLLILSLNWFPQKYFALFCGLSLFLGAVGPMLAGAPLAYVYELSGGDWRGILYWIGLFGILLTLSLMVFIRNKPANAQNKIIFITPHEPTLGKIFVLLKNRQVWAVLSCCSFLYVSIPLFAAYWGTTYLQTRGLEKTEAAFAISMIWAGYAIGNPLLGKISDTIKRRKPFLVLFCFMGVLTSLFILFSKGVNYPLLITLFFFLGFSSSTQGIAFAAIVEHTPRKLNSTALGLNNSMGMLLGAVLPALASWIIQTSQHHSGRLSLTTGDMRSGLLLIPVFYGVATLIAFFGVKETFCRQQHEIHKMSDLI